MQPGGKTIGNSLWLTHVVTNARKTSLRTFLGVSTHPVAIKLLHTAMWALLAGCILALPLTPLLHRFD